MRRTDGAEKVSGALIFTEDMPLAGLAHAKLVLSENIYIFRPAHNSPYDRANHFWNPYLDRWKPLGKPLRPALKEEDIQLAWRACVAASKKAEEERASQLMHLVHLHQLKHANDGMIYSGSVLAAYLFMLVASWFLA